MPVEGTSTPAAHSPVPARVLSGIQPTGRFHWGNYFGAIRQYIDLQPSHRHAGDQPPDAEAYYVIADLHALTTVREPDRLRSLVHDAAVDLVSLGLDPDRATLFVQSDVPEVTELTWLLMTVTPMGLLERCHAYKDKKTRGLPADAGLFTYPVLMSADILAYDATVVPVGEDQVQHIEVCRDLAGTFNHLYGDVFTLPKPRLVEGGGRVPGTDGQKMSKSYDNTLEVFDDPAAQKKKIMRITTDSRPMEEPKNPEDDHLFALYALLAPEADRLKMADLYRRGGFGYGEVKKALAEAAAQFFAEARARRAALEADPERIEAILTAGAERARAKARAVLDRARRACGLARGKAGKPSLAVKQSGKGPRA
jgi:tryptophanyl-tRNA synthetase